MQIFQKKRHIIISYLVITLGIMLYTFAWSAVMLPAKIVGGGVRMKAKLSGKSKIFCVLFWSFHKIR